MISLRHFVSEDARIICDRIYPGMGLEQASSIIAQWNSFLYEGKRFLMNGIWAENELVGTLSLLEVDKNAVSFGIEIVSQFRGKGFSYEAGKLGIKQASSMGFQTMVSQVRQDNYASIALHRKLGFERYDSGVSRRGKPVFFYRKDLSTEGKLSVS